MRPPVIEPLPGTVLDPMYPDGDGRPLGDTDFHSTAMTLLRQGMQDFFAKRDDVYAGMNLILYYEQGRPDQRRDPDVLVAKGVRGKHARRSFRVWEEGTLPCTLFEIVSKKTVREDVVEKRALYERLRIPEYFLFDPEGIYLDPVLRGFRLRRNKYEALMPGDDGSLVSKELGLRLVPEGMLLRLIDLKSGVPVPTREERADELAAEVERLRKLLERATRDPKP